MQAKVIVLADKGGLKHILLHSSVNSHLATKVGITTDKHKCQKLNKTENKMESRLISHRKITINTVYTP